MKTWDYVYISDYYDYQSGLSKPASDFGFGYPFLSFSEIFNNSFVPSKLGQLVNSTTDEQKTCSIKKGDVFLTRTSETVDELGMSCVALKDYPNATFNGFTKRLRPNTLGIEEILPLYIGYYLRSIYFRGEITAYSNPTTRASLNNGILNKLKILLPPLPIQRKIAAILSAYDELIENNNRRIAILEKMAEEIYREWFVRLRFPGHEKVKVVKGVPEGWEVKKVKDIVDRKPFGKIYRESDLSEDGKIIVIDQSTKDYLGFYDGEPEHMASIDEPIILFGDHSCKMLLMIKPFSLAENVVPFKSRHKIPIVYLYYMVHNLIETTEYKRHWTELTNKSVFVPTKHLQESFSEFAKPLLLKKDKLVASTNALKKSRDLLLPRLISGKLDVEHLDIVFPPGMEEERS